MIPEFFSLSDDYATREVDSDVIYLFILMEILIDMLALTMMMMIMALMLVT